MIQKTAKDLNSSKNKNTQKLKQNSIDVYNSLKRWRKSKLRLGQKK